MDFDIPAQRLVPGRSCYGVVTDEPEQTEANAILVAARIGPGDYRRVRRAIGVIVEEGGPSSHVSVVCRTIGVPLLRVDNATQLLRPGDRIFLDCDHGHVLSASARHDPTGIRDADPELAARLRELRLQLSILEPRHIDEANALLPDNIEQHFLRGEFLWTYLGENPYDYVERHGREATAERIANELRDYADRLAPGQLLSMRSIDVRSDEFLHLREGAIVEANPQLGLHGLRHQLVEPAVISAEICAMQRLADLGYDNVVFSLPFVTDETEVQRAQALMAELGGRDIKLAVFIEVPSAVYQIREILALGIHHAIVGTKDLTQLLLAADRSNYAVAHISNLRHPAVLKAIASVTEACHEASVPVFVFTTVEDFRGMLESLPADTRFSICYGDARLLAGAIQTSDGGV